MATQTTSLTAWLSGKKTYLVAAIAAVLNFLVAVNAIDPSHLSEVNTILGALGLAALRDGVSKS